MPTQHCPPAVISREKLLLYSVLPVIFGVRVLGNGAHCVPELIVLEVVMSLNFSRRCVTWWDMAVLYGLYVAAATTTLTSEYYHPDMSWEWVGVMLLLQLPLQMVYILPYVADRIMFDIPFAGSVCFPTAYTGLQILLIYVSPGGSWGVAGYCASYDTPRNLALLSLMGLSGVHFFLAATSSCFLMYTSTALSLGGGAVLPVGAYYDDEYDSAEEEEEIEEEGGPSQFTSEDEAFSSSRGLGTDTSLLSRGGAHGVRMNGSSTPIDPVLDGGRSSVHCSHTVEGGGGGGWLQACGGVAPWKGMLLLLMVFLLYGSFYNASPTLLGRQEDRKTINLACVAVANGHLIRPDELLDLTRSIANNGSQMVLWSERPCSIRKEDETSLKLDATRLAVHTHTYIGLSYELDQPTGKRSMFSLVDPDGTGSIPLQVGRVHTSPFGKGPGDAGPVVRAVPTSIGKLGAVMGFDLSFPQFVQDVAADGVMLVLSPAEDYGPIYALQWNQAALRAAEQGTTVAYCSSMQGLVVVDPYGATLLNVPLARDQTVAVLTGTITLGERTTLYSLTGDAFGFLCLGLATLCLIVGRIHGLRSNLATWLVTKWRKAQGQQARSSIVGSLHRDDQSLPRV